MNGRTLADALAEIRLDSSRLAGDMADVERAIKSRLAGIEKLLNLKVGIDLADLNRRLEQVDAAVRKADPQLKLTLDDESVAKVSAQVEKIGDDVEVEVRLDQGQLAAEVAEANTTLGKIDKSKTVEIDGDTGGLERAAAAAETRLEAIPDETVKIVPEWSERDAQEALAAAIGWGEVFEDVIPPAKIEPEWSDADAREALAAAIGWGEALDAAIPPIKIRAESYVSPDVAAAKAALESLPREHLIKAKLDVSDVTSGTTEVMAIIRNTPDAVLGVDLDYDEALANAAGAGVAIDQALGEGKFEIRIDYDEALANAIGIGAAVDQAVGYATMEVDIDGVRAVAAAKGWNAAVREAFHDPRIMPDVDTTTATERIIGFAGSAAALLSKIPGVDINVDTGLATEKVLAFREFATAALLQLTGNIDVDAGGATARIVAFVAQLKAIPDKVTTKLDVDGSAISVGGALGGAISAIKGAFQQLDGDILGIVSGTSKGIASLISTSMQGAGQALVGNLSGAMRTWDNMFGEFGKSFSGIVKSSDEAADGVDKKWSSVLGGLGKSVSTVTGALSGGFILAGGVIGTALTGISAGISKFGIEAAAAFETAEVAFSGMLGSDVGGTRFVQSLKSFAATTPFEFDQMTVAAQKLMGTFGPGFAGQVIPTMETIGARVASIGGSAASIDRVVLALSQMQGKGKATGEEFKQISEAIPGFNAYAAIAEQKGISVAQAMAEVKKRTISADESFEAIMTSMRAFPGASDALIKQSQTISGVLSTLKDNAKIGLADAFTGLGEAAKPVLASLGESFKNGPIRGVLDSISTGLSEIMPLITPIIDGLGTGLGSALKGTFEGLKPLLEGLAPLFAPLGEVLGSLAKTAGQALGALAPSFLALANALVPIVNILGPAIVKIISALEPALTPIIELVGALAVVLADGLADVMPSVADAFIALFEAAEPLIPIIVRLTEIVAVVTAQGLKLFAAGIELAADAIAPFILALSAGIGMFLDFTDTIGGFLSKIPGAGIFKSIIGTDDVSGTLVEVEGGFKAVGTAAYETERALRSQNAEANRLTAQFERFQKEAYQVAELRFSGLAMAISELATPAERAMSAVEGLDKALKELGNERLSLDQAIAEVEEFLDAVVLAKDEAGKVDFNVRTEAGRANLDTLTEAAQKFSKEAASLAENLAAQGKDPGDAWAGYALRMGELKQAFIDAGGTASEFERMLDNYDLAPIDVKTTLDGASVGVLREEIAKIAADPKLTDIETVLTAQLDKGQADLVAAELDALKTFQGEGGDVKLQAFLDDVSARGVEAALASLIEDNPPAKLDAELDEGTVRDDYNTLKGDIEKNPPKPKLDVDDGEAKTKIRTIRDGGDVPIGFKVGIEPESLGTTLSYLDEFDRPRTVTIGPDVDFAALAAAEEGLKKLDQPRKPTVTPEVAEQQYASADAKVKQLERQLRTMVATDVDPAKFQEVNDQLAELERKRELLVLATTDGSELTRVEGELDRLAAEREALLSVVPDQASIEKANADVTAMTEEFREAQVNVSLAQDDLAVIVHDLTEATREREALVTAGADQASIDAADAKITGLTDRKRDIELAIQLGQQDLTQLNSQLLELTATRDALVAVQADPAKIAELDAQIAEFTSRKESLIELRSDPAAQQALLDQITELTKTRDAMIAADVDPSAIASVEAQLERARQTRDAIVKPVVDQTAGAVALKYVDEFDKERTVTLKPGIDFEALKKTDEALKKSLPPEERPLDIAVSDKGTIKTIRDSLDKLAKDKPAPVVTTTDRGTTKTIRDSLDTIDRTKYGAEITTTDRGTTKTIRDSLDTIDRTNYNAIVTASDKGTTKTLRTQLDQLAAANYNPIVTASDRGTTKTIQDGLSRIVSTTYGPRVDVTDGGSVVRLDTAINNASRPRNQITSSGHGGTVDALDRAINNAARDRAQRTNAGHGGTADTLDSALNNAARDRAQRTNAGHGGTADTLDSAINNAARERATRVTANGNVEPASTAITNLVTTPWGTVVKVGGDDANARGTVGGFGLWAAAQQAVTRLGANSADANRTWENFAVAIAFAQIWATLRLNTQRATGDYNNFISDQRFGLQNLGGYYPTMFRNGGVTLQQFRDGGAVIGANNPTIAAGMRGAHQHGDLPNQHQPEIALPAGSLRSVRIWAEPETRGEAYIPLANDYRRPRAEKILGAVAENFGMKVLPMSDYEALTASVAQAQVMTVRTELDTTELSRAVGEEVARRVSAIDPEAIAGAVGTAVAAANQADYTNPQAIGSIVRAEVRRALAGVR